MLRGEEMDDDPAWLGALLLALLVLLTVATLTWVTW